jgi:hypothetical protein
MVCLYLIRNLMHIPVLGMASYISSCCTYDPEASEREPLKPDLKSSSPSLAATTTITWCTVFHSCSKIWRLVQSQTPDLRSAGDRRPSPFGSSLIWRRFKGRSAQQFHTGLFHVLQDNLHSWLQSVSFLFRSGVILCDSSCKEKPALVYLFAYTWTGKKAAAGVLFRFRPEGSL